MPQNKQKNQQTFETQFFASRHVYWFEIIVKCVRNYSPEDTILSTKIASIGASFFIKCHFSFARFVPVLFSHFDPFSPNIFPQQIPTFTKTTSTSQQKY